MKEKSIKARSITHLRLILLEQILRFHRWRLERIVSVVVAAVVDGLN